MRRKPDYALAALLILGFILTACQAQPGVNTQPATTPTLSDAAPTPTKILPATQVTNLTPTPTQVLNPETRTGSIKGRLGYPSEVVPPLMVVAFLYGTDTFFSISTDLNQTEYQLSDLPEGNYHLVAYTQDSGSFPTGLAGGFTQAVLCGMGGACTDHSLVDIALSGGQTVENADIVDWLVPLPPMPQAGSAVMGAITGNLYYPSEVIPPMRVVAFSVADEQFYTVDTHEMEAFYVLTVPAGNYYVVAYSQGGEGFPSGLAGGYTEAMLCGLSVDCEDHSLVEISVVQGSVVTGIDPGDFYAPEGTFPPMP